MAGRVDQVELIGLAVPRLVDHANGVGLDGDAALSLQVHGVEHLGVHLSLGNRAGELKQAVAQRRLAVVDVGNNGEVAYETCFHNRSKIRAFRPRRVLRLHGIAYHRNSALRVVTRAATGSGIGVERVDAFECRSHRENGTLHGHRFPTWIPDPVKSRVFTAYELESLVIVRPCAAGTTPAGDCTGRMRTRGAGERVHSSASPGNSAGPSRAGGDHAAARNAARCASTLSGRAAARPCPDSTGRSRLRPWRCRLQERHAGRGQSGVRPRG